MFAHWNPGNSPGSLPHGFQFTSLLGMGITDCRTLNKDSPVVRLGIWLGQYNQASVMMHATKIHTL
jgi:hypothetical protein